MNNYNGGPHKTWFKLVFNPVLRKIGWQICSIIEDNTHKVLGYRLLPYPDYCKVKGDTSKINLRLYIKKIRDCLSLR